MAVTTKTTNTVNVIVQDANNGSTTFKLDNPKAGVTFGEIKSAFDNVINTPIDDGAGGTDNANLLCTKTGYDLIAVVGAEKVTTVITKETLE